jgi:hypothetical protein
MAVIILSSCSVIKKFAGADIDEEQFAKAREAKILEMRYEYALKLNQKLSNNSAALNTDINISLSSDLVQKIVRQYEGSNGWLDEKTSYTINKITTVLLFGSASATMELLAHNDTYNVNVHLLMDCLIVFDVYNQDLVVKVEPYNISPDVKAGGIIGALEGIISNLVKINVGDISKNFPPLKYPVNFINQFTIQKSFVQIKDKLNMNIYNPQKTISYKMKLNDVLINEGTVYVALSIENVEIK